MAEPDLQILLIYLYHGYIKQNLKITYIIKVYYAY